MLVSNRFELHCLGYMLELEAGWKSDSLSPEGHYYRNGYSRRLRGQVLGLFGHIELVRMRPQEAAELLPDYAGKFAVWYEGVRVRRERHEAAAQRLKLAAAAWVEGTAQYMPSDFKGFCERVTGLNVELAAAQAEMAASDAEIEAASQEEGA